MQGIDLQSSQDRSTNLLKFSLFLYSKRLILRLTMNIFAYLT